MSMNVLLKLCNNLRRIFPDHLSFTHTSLGETTDVMYVTHSQKYIGKECEDRASPERPSPERTNPERTTLERTSLNPFRVETGFKT